MIMYNPFSLRGKTILVTGASSGIGRSIAIEAAKMGAQIILSARNHKRLETTLSLLETGENMEHKFIVADLSKELEILTLIKSIDCKIDGVVHCAGYTVPKLFQSYKSEEIEGMMAVNFKAPFMLTQLLLKNRKIEKGASIVFISSISGVYVSSIAGSLYSATKGAINGMAKGLALEVAPKGIRVNCVNPGMVDTNILSNSVITGEQLEVDMKKYPLKRYGKPEEVAYAVIYLLSDASSWTTGTNLLIDGGYTLL